MGTTFEFKSSRGYFARSLLHLWAIFLVANLHVRFNQDVGSRQARFAQVGAAEEATTSEQPAFPEPASFKYVKFKIVSEIIDEQDVAARTQEEYVDLRRGKASFVTSTSTGHFVRYLDADEGLCFTYRPYKCNVQPLKDLSSDQQTGNLDQIVGPGGKSPLSNFNTEIQVNLQSDGDDFMWTQSSPIQGPVNRPAKTKPLRLFGVSGLWLMAALEPKLFLRANIIYSSSTDAYRPALLWKVNHGDYEYEFYFMEQPMRSKRNDAAGGPSNNLVGEPTLEMIKIISSKDKAVVRTINILSIEGTIPAEAYDEILSVPLGYGCFSSLLDAYANDKTAPQFVDLVRMRRAYVNRHSIGGASTWTGRAELEVTATKVSSDASGQQASRSSDTFSVELAQTSRTAKTPSEGPYLKLIRWRNTREDKKLVINEMLRVKYHVDMLRGTCQMEHLVSLRDEQVLIKFANGAEFDANIKLFDEGDDLHFVKVTSGDSNKRHLHHYEGTAASKELVGWLTSSTGATEEEAKRTRVVRSYSMDGSDSLELVSITIWLLDETETNIRESYQIYVIDYRDEDYLTELAEERAKQFDISYECYLENEQMVQNRDFAWFQLSYPASQRMLSLVASNSEALKQLYFERFVQDLTLVPRVELLFEEDKFKFRTLMLDLPPVELIYDKEEKTQLMPTIHHETDHDLVYMEPDLRHCSHQCRLNHCTVMSYCYTNKMCTLSKAQLYFIDKDAVPVKLANKFSFTENANCDTYTIPALFENGGYKHARLTSTLASLQHQNYDAKLELPPPPEEITMSLSDSGLSDAERSQAQLEYAAQVEELLKKDNRIPYLAFPVQLAGNYLFLTPNKFELESDPLSEFGLHDSTNQLEGDSLGDSPDGQYDDDDQRVPHFHQGLTMARLNIAQMHNIPQPGSDHQQPQVSFHSFRGLNYDQCAMACWDSKCGTFSFCDQGGECILSSAKTLGHAKALGLVETAPDCMIAQRDFLGNFVKFPNVYRPQVYKSISSEPVLDPSQCALNCIAETSYRCMSFQYCSDSISTNEVTSKTQQQGGQCYYQASHHSLNEEAPTQTGCDHYARSQLADYVRLDARRVVHDVVDKLKTSTYTDLTVFGCAEKCSNELMDCSAFQFCIDPRPIGERDSVNFRECLTIESKITLSMLKNKSNQETIVDESKGGDEIIQQGDYLTYDVDCQVFSMRKESSQAHLRDLAFGGLIRTSSDKPKGQQETGTKMSLFGAIVMYVAVTAVTAFITCGAILLASESEFIRQRVERLRIVTGF